MGWDGMVGMSVHLYRWIYVYIMQVHACMLVTFSERKNGEMVFFWGGWLYIYWGSVCVLEDVFSALLPLFLQRFETWCVKLCFFCNLEKNWRIASKQASKQESKEN